MAWRIDMLSVMDDATLQCLPDDPAALKQLVRERDRRVAQLDQERRDRDQRIAALEQKQQQLELEKLRLAHQLELLRKRYYGPRADRVTPGQLLLEFALALEARPLDASLLPAAGNATAVRRVRPPGGRRDLALFDKLPVTTKVHDLSPEEKPCPCCGTPRKQIGQEDSWQIEYLPASFHRIQHVRLKYACPKCEPNGQNPQIALADKPPEAAPISKGMAGPGLLAYMVTSKFADYLPLYRLEGIFARNGFAIDRSTMCVWTGDVADLVGPLYDLMVRRVLASHVVHTDDTVMPMLAPEKTRQARMWVYVGDDSGGPYNVFDFTLSRSRDGPAQFLGKHFKGVLQADAYGGYDGICVEKAITQAGCWAHARRKFVDTQKLEPAITGEALTLIGKLFAIEAQAKDFSCADRLALRQRESRPVLDALHQSFQAWRQKLLPKHPVAQAIGYALNQWEPLSVFLHDGAVAIDNNAAEREMKRQALNRKNSLFVGNERGGHTAAVLSSITSTCRRHDIDPQFYLTQLLANLPATPLSQLGEWLPDRWKQRQATITTSAVVRSACGS
jgi:transposase